MAKMGILQYLDCYDQKEEHVGEHVGEALVQEPGGEPAIGLRAHEGPPASPPHYQKVPSQQPCVISVAPGRCLHTNTSKVKPASACAFLADMEQKGILGIYRFGDISAW